MKVRHKRSECADSGAVSHVSVDSVRIAAESIGISVLPDDAARELAEHTTHRLRLLVQDAAKFHAHSKRKQLHLSDVDNALRVRNMEPLYGLSCSEHVPFRFASGGGRELAFRDERELDLAEVVATPVPRAPLDTAVKVHWLCIDGVQPAVPENPAPKSHDQQKQETSNPAAKMSRQPVAPTAKSQRARTIETVSVKQLAQHELSVELQLFYKEITEACVGSDEARRTEALHSLASDPGLHQTLPRLCNFIFEGVKVNVVQYNLALLIYLMRMVKALLDNQTLFLEKYLHELIPSVASCIVSRQLCARPEVDNHWALRDFAARLMALVSKQFSTSTNNVQTRISRLFMGCLENRRAPLAAHYGAVAGLIELGPEVINACVMPQLGPIGERIEHLCGAATGASQADRKACEHFKELFKRKISSVLASHRSSPDVAEEYRRDYGATLGNVLYAAVIKERQQQQLIAANKTSTAASTGTGTASTSCTPASASTTTTAAVGTPRIISGGAQRTIMVTVPSTIARNVATVTTSAAKVVLVTPGPTTLANTGVEAGTGVMASAVATAAQAMATTITTTTFSTSAAVVAANTVSTGNTATVSVQNSVAASTFDSSAVIKREEHN